MSMKKHLYALKSLLMTEQMKNQMMTTMMKLLMSMVQRMETRMAAMVMAMTSVKVVVLALQLVETILGIRILKFFALDLKLVSKLEV
jgi:hypothetical protein